MAMMSLSETEAPTLRELLIDISGTLHSVLDALEELNETVNAEMDKESTRLD